MAVISADQTTQQQIIRITLYVTRTVGLNRTTYGVKISTAKI
jgi:hypothetical protein